MITKQDILQATNQGLDIFLRYYPDAEKCTRQRNHKFKARPEEKTASASIMQMENGLWIYTDFGSDSKGKNAIDFVMDYENLSFSETLNFLAEKFNISSDYKSLPTPTAKISSRPATPEEAEGYYYELKDTPSEADIQNVLSPKTIEYLGADWATKAREIFMRYGFKALKSYSRCKPDKKGDMMYYTFEATDSYPIYIWLCKDFKKIYTPKEQKYSRFQYDGKPKQDYLFGYDIAHRAWQEQTNIKDDNEEEEDTKKKKTPKLDSVILCSGGSDALNLACLNQLPIWMNSETAKLTGGQYRNLQIIAEIIYNLPDIDKTGLKAAHELATEYLDIHTIYLPATMADTWAPNGKPKKDLRDFLLTYRGYQFFELLKIAYPYRFWDANMQFNKLGEYIGIKYDVRNKRLYNFLERNGFYRYKSESSKDGYIFIQIIKNIVREITSKDIRDFINQFLEDRKMDDKLLDTFLRTTQLSEASLSNLKFIEIDFVDNDFQTQWLFFQNTVLEVSKKEIVAHRLGAVDKFVWEKEVSPHRVTLEQPQFEITKPDQYDIQLNNPCMVLQYLINSSRIFWREELENRLPTNDKLAKEYIAQHKFSIDGPNLTPEEQQIQKLHLINKIFSIGFLLHTYKNSSKAWAVWAMDNKISDANESHGGSGKSLNYKGLLHFKNNVQLEGRNPKLIDNPHVYENITPHTDLVLIDDASRYIKFDFFFSAITGPINVNPKNNKQYAIPFTESPKIIFTSNFPPYNADPSIERRLLYTVFSDYYHFNRLDEYQEERKVSDDFGQNLFDDFSEAEWNRTINFYAQCIHFYLNTKEKINPPLDNVNKRNLKAIMGDNFQDWADVYFAPDSGKLNEELIKEEAFEDCKRSIGLNKFTPQQFKHSLNAWCQYYGYEFNPKEFLGDQSRKTKRIKALDKDGNTIEKMKEVILIRTPTETIEDLPF